jgi:hypothetical protein
MIQQTQTPIVTGDYELQAAVDMSGSMDELVASDSRMTKWDVVKEGLGAFVQAVEMLDSQAEREQASGGDGEDTGGVWTVAFNARVHELQDVTYANIGEKFGALAPSGGTYLLPAIRELDKKYKKEFGHLDVAERPSLVRVIFGDGKPSDEREFEAILAATPDDGGIYYLIVVMGYDAEYQKAVAAYEAIAAKHPTRVRVLRAGEETSGKVIANALLQQIGKAA